MPICALVGAADFNKKHFIDQRFDCVIAVDAGYENLLYARIKPQIVVGDFDSLGYIPDSIDINRFPVEKDESDMELALHLASAQGFSEMVIYGALTKRLDHTLANLQVMCSFANKGARVIGVGDSFVVIILDSNGVSEVSFEAFNPENLDASEYGRFVSVFSSNEAAFGVSVAGLKYELEDAQVPFGVSLGLSNEFTGDPATISVKDGSIIVTIPIGAWRYLKGV